MSLRGKGVSFEDWEMEYQGISGGLFIESWQRTTGQWYETGSGFPYLNANKSAGGIMYYSCLINIHDPS